MSELLAEVDEVMRQERMMKFWKENGKTIIAVVTMIILGTALGSGYRAWDEHTRAADTNLVLNMLEAESFPENVKTAALDIRPGLKGVVLMSAAKAYLADDKKGDALALYTRAADDGKIPGDIRQLATLMTVRLMLGQGEGTADLQARLEPIWSDKDSPWRFHAHLEAATLLAHVDKNFAGARGHLAKILEGTELPDTLYTNAKSLDHVYALQLQKQQQENNKEGS